MSNIFFFVLSIKALNPIFLIQLQHIISLSISMQKQIKKQGKAVFFALTCVLKIRRIQAASATV